MMKHFLIFFATLALVPMSATSARTLHYGVGSIELTTEQKTFPALHFLINGTEKAYAALYTTAAPENSIRIGRDNITEYWVGDWCDAGQYAATINCADCGYGYYCTGGTARATCTGGAIACNTKTATSDTWVDSSLLNRFLSKDEAQSLLPITTFDDWELVSMCNTRVNEKYDNDVRNNIFLVFESDVGGCPVTVIGPGTYLFTTVGTCNPGYYTITAYVAVFDHAVSYKSVHADGVFSTLIDTKSTVFSDYDVAAPGTGKMAWCHPVDASNISDLETKLSTSFHMRVYRLK